MAISTATVINAFDFQRLSDRTHTISSEEYEVWTCKCSCDFKTVDYATANDATISPVTAITAARRNGKTPVVLAVGFVSPGVYRLAATPTVDSLYGGGGTVSVTSSVATVVLTAEDLTTEMTNTEVLSTATPVVPSVWQVTFYEPVEGA